MDFTEIYKHNASLVAFSPGTHFLLTAVQDRLIVRRSDSFQIARTWQLSSSSLPPTSTGTAPSQPPPKSKPPPASEGYITHAAWSSDSEYLFAACAKKGFVEVFKMRDDQWRARIDAGAEGLARAEWAPDGRSILCFSEWGLRVTIWSLVTSVATYIQYPIHPDRGYAFRLDGQYFVLAERHRSKDSLGVYDAYDAYRLVRHFPLPTSTMSSLSLSPNGNYVAVWEGPLEFKVHILSLTGTLLGTFTPEPDPGFGVRMAVWHPNGLYLAVGGADDKIYILESLTWGCVAVLDIQTRIPSDVIIWREPDKWLEATHGRGFISYERIRPPHVIPSTSKPSTSSASGISQLAFNTDGTLLLARSSSTPTVAHIFSFPSPTAPASGRADKEADRRVRLRSVLQHTRVVMCARWNPERRGSLALSCGSGGLYLWSDEWVSEGAGGGTAARDEGDADADTDVDGELAECVGVPAKKFETREVKWAPDGKGLVLLDKDTFCCAFEVEEEGQ